jgi:small subunit ribosomal protein S1
MKKLAKTQNNETQKPIKDGDTVEGAVIGTGRSSIFFDLGALGTGTIYGHEFYKSKEMLKDLNKGDVISLKVVDLENEEGYIELSLDKAFQDKIWDELKEKRDNDESIIVKVLNANKGGLIVKVDGIQGFIPVSQLSPENYPRVSGGDGDKILTKLQELVDADLEVKVFDVDPGKEKLILSEKAKESKKIQENIKNYEVGEVVEGEITGLVDFGVFVKFSKDDSEPIEGLIHISELDWKIISDPSQIVNIGEKVKAKIIEITNQKISLSLKALKDNPWEEIEKEYKKGDKIKGKVAKFNPFGAFVEINPKVQGLVHISEFESKEEMEKELVPGKEYNFEIISIDSNKYRMILKKVK